MPTELKVIEEQNKTTAKTKNNLKQTQTSDKEMQMTKTEKQLQYKWMKTKRHKKTIRRKNHHELTLILALGILLPFCIQGPIISFCSCSMDA